jgi:hypothetical protein
MSFTNPPPDVTALRDMLLACPSIAVASSAMHYPDAPVAGAGTLVTGPFWVLTSTETRRAPFAEAGVRGLAAGSLVASYYATGDAGTLETYARLIEYELTGVVGLPNLGVSVGLASDPSQAARAADSDGEPGASLRQIQLLITYGLNP